MRSAGNFSPEWGYLAPVPSFARTARVVLVATAIGATAGAGVVLSLVDRPAKPERTPVAAHAIVTSVRAAPAAPEIGAAPVTPAAAPVSGPTAPPIATTETSGQAPARPQVTPPASGQQGSQAAAAAPSIPDHQQPVQASAPTAPQENAGQPNAGSTPATGIAALSEPSATATATPADAPDGGTAALESANQKKAKHHAGYGRTPLPGLGTLFRRFFVAHAGRSYYPNR